MKNKCYLLSVLISFCIFLPFLLHSLIKYHTVSDFIVSMIPIFVFCPVFFGSIANNLLEKQKDQIWILAVIFLVAMLIYNQIYQKEDKVDSLPATRAIPSAVATKVVPPTEADWYEILEGIYARTTAEYTECYFYGNGADYCAGETVEYYTLEDQAIVYEQALLRKITTMPVFAGSKTTVRIPADAINIHWRFIDTDPNN